jgi:hypothetical protein
MPLPRLTKNMLEQAVIIDELRGNLEHTVAALDDEKKRTGKLVDAVYRAAHAASLTFEYTPPAPPEMDGRDQTAEVACIFMSDWQLGKKTPTYDSDVCAARIRQYVDIARRIVDDRRTSRPVRDVHLFCLGDMIEGELIFPGQAHRIDASLFRQVCVYGPEILLGLVLNLLAMFDNVYVHWVKGNHGDIGGRGRREMHPESNADAMLYEIVKARLEGEPRVKCDPTYVENEGLWYSVSEAAGYGFLIFHGYQTQGQNVLGYPQYAMGKKVMGWASGAVPEHFDYSISAHYHTPFRFNVGRLTHWGNGTTESSNTFAQESLAAISRPSQWLFFVHPGLGVVAEHEVRLT